MAPIPISEFKRGLPDLLETLRHMVEMESPTNDKAAVDRFGAWIGGEMSRLGADVNRYDQAGVGDHWLGRWGDGGDGILILGHIDTVHPIGTLSHFPWREEGERIYGPGILDMKAGLGLALTAARRLRQNGALGTTRLSMLLTSDEETGSETSRALIEQLAREHSLVLVLEPGLTNGALKTWRKGIGDFHLQVQGRAAHAGGDPENGVNAIVEMSHQIRQLQALANQEMGTTVNAGVIEGGTRSNVVAEKCSLRVDIRVMTEQEQARIEGDLDRLAPQLQGAKISVAGGWNRPPMPRSTVIADTFNRASSIAAQLGIDLDEGGTGGGSDANFVAPLGIPLLDGLGAIGGGAHSSREHIIPAELPARAALLTAIISDWF